MTSQVSGAIEYGTITAGVVGISGLIFLDIFRNNPKISYIYLGLATVAVAGATWYGYNNAS